MRAFLFNFHPFLVGQKDTTRATWKTNTGEIVIRGDTNNGRGTWVIRPVNVAISERPVFIKVDKL